MQPEEIARLIAGGETLTVEFKSEAKGPLKSADLIEAAICLTNGDGGMLLLGVEDDGTITGVAKRQGKIVDPLLIQGIVSSGTTPPLSVGASLHEFDGVQIVAIEVPQSRTPVGTTGGLYKRRALKTDGSPQCVPYPLHEMLSHGTSVGEVDYARLRVVGASWEDLDPAEFNRFRGFVGAAGSSGDAVLGDLSDIDVARALGVLATDDGTPAMGALLLFGRPESLRRFLPTHEVAFQVMRGTAVEVNAEINGGLLYAAEELLRRFQPYNPEEEVDAGLLRIRIPLLPEVAFREAVANALVHRDYTAMGITRVQISQDAVTVSSPGGFPAGVRLDNILDESRPRSQTLANAFKRAGLVERTGRGIQRMYASTLRIGREAPDYSRSSELSVVATFPTAPADLAIARYVFNREQETGQTTRLEDLQILAALRRDGILTLNQVASLTQKTESQARSALGRMVDDGLVQPRGNARGREYHLAPGLYRALGAGASYVRTRGYDPIQWRQMVLNFVSAHGTITRANAADLCAITPAQASTLLRSMAADGELVMRGTRRTADYVLP